uniref:HECT-type E3 ubiquitin transferase n=1 Tax=Parastrongyloides trichosuri TaxID=131310 RepID=A0A0N4ZV23_PARTI
MDGKIKPMGEGPSNIKTGPNLSLEEAKKLRVQEDSKLLNAYLQQIKKGCGRFMCDNRSCASSGYIKQDLEEHKYLKFAIEIMKAKDKLCPPIEFVFPSCKEIKVSVCKNLILEFKETKDVKPLKDFINHTLFKKENILCQIVHYELAQRFCEIMFLEEKRIREFSQAYYDFHFDENGGKRINIKRHLQKASYYKQAAVKDRIKLFERNLRYPGENHTRKKLNIEKSPIMKDMMKKFPNRVDEEEEIFTCIKLLKEVILENNIIRKVYVCALNKMVRELFDLYSLSNAWKSNQNISLIFLKFFLTMPHIISIPEFYTVNLVDIAKVFSLVGYHVRNKIARFIASQNVEWIRNWVDDIQQALTIRSVTIRAYTDTLEHDFFDGEDLPGLLCMLEIFHTAVLNQKKKSEDSDLVVRYDNPHIKILTKNKSKKTNNEGPSNDNPGNIPQTEGTNTQPMDLESNDNPSTTSAPWTRDSKVDLDLEKPGWCEGFDRDITDKMHHIDVHNNSRNNYWNTHAYNTTLPLNYFINDELSTNVDVDKDFRAFKTGFSTSLILDFPFAFHTGVKHSFLMEYNKWRMKVEQSTQMNSTFEVDDDDDDDITDYLQIQVRREEAMNDSLNWLSNVFSKEKHRFNVRKQLRVQFEGEEGIDEGGLSKEFYQIITKKIFDPDYGMFIFNKDSGTYWFNPQCTYCDMEYVLIGLMIAMALYNEVMIDVSFPVILYKRLLSSQVELEDMKSFDKVMYNSFKNLLQTSDVEDIFCLNFSVSYKDVCGTEHTYELIENGSNIPVTDSNKKEYVYRYVKYLLIDQVKHQFDKFATGFFMVTNPILLRALCHPEEIDQFICGVVELDLNLLQKHVSYTSGYTADSQTIKDFWKVVHEFNLEQKRQLLEFITGSHRIPVGGYKSMEFSIQRHGDLKDHLPSSHTCYNFLLLPDYKDYNILKERLTLALKYCKGFGLQ